MICVEKPFDVRLNFLTFISVLTGRSDNEGGEVRTRSRNARREDPRRHTLGGNQDQYFTMSGQGGPLSRTMDLEVRNYKLKECDVRKIKK